MSTWTHLLRLWRVVILMVGALDIGMVAYVVFAYLTGRIAPAGPYRRTWHVVGIATSYLLLCAALWFVIAGRAIDGRPVTWRLWFATAAYPIGFAALARLVRHTRDGGGEKDG